jgi:hypothetical protein
MDDDKLKIIPPLYMVGQKIHCWRCEARMPVITLLAPNVVDTENQVCLLSGIENIPKEVLSFIQRRVPTFKLKFSKTTSTKYFANTCPKCGVLYGDFFLHDEPGSPFFPEDEKDAQSLYIKEIPISKPVEIKAGLSLGLGEIILSNAKKV